MDPPKKQLIYITPDELDRLPPEAPVYVLSSSRDDSKTQGPLLPTPTSVTPSLNCHLPDAMWASTPSLVGYPNQPTNPTLFPPPLSSFTIPPPFPLNMHTPQHLNSQPPYHPPLPLQFFPPPLNPQPLAHLSSAPNISVPPNHSNSSHFNRSTKKATAPNVSSSSRDDRQCHREDRGQLTYSSIWCTPSDDFFETNGTCKVATPRMIALENEFEKEVLGRRNRALSGCVPVDELRPPLKRPEIVDNDPEDRSPIISKNGRKRPNQKKRDSTVSSLTEPDAITPDNLMDAISSNLTSSPCLDKHSRNADSLTSSGDPFDRTIQQQIEVSHKVSHPHRLHPSIWHNEAGEHNSGPACSCKPKYRIGPLHNQFEGETEVPRCRLESNNRDRLYHYRVMVTPTTNFFNCKPTIIPYNGNDYFFDGYSVFLHSSLEQLPPCQLLRFNLLYEFVAVADDFPENLTVRAMDMLTKYIFQELLELLDLNWLPHGAESGCPVVHLFPRFVRKVGDASAELLSVNHILEYWMGQSRLPLIRPTDLSAIQRMANSEWSARIDDLRGTLAWKPGVKPPAIRIDQLDRSFDSSSSSSTNTPRSLPYPLLVHMTFTPMKLSLSRDPKYKSVLKNFMKLEYLMNNKPRITAHDRAQRAQLANKLDSMDQSGVHRREITVGISSEGFYRTGIRPDVTQFALNMASFVTHIRCIMSLKSLEARLGYEFKDKSLLHQALTHPSYRRTDFGTNQDHFQNTQTSCGPRTIVYGDKLQLYKQWRKKGLSSMIKVMSFMPKQHEERSKIYGNERLEFLGDAVIEVIASIHLFFMFPDLPEGNLDAYRQALVQNQHLADLALRLGLHKYLLYTHSVDFCYDSTYVYTRSDAFEAVMGKQLGIVFLKTTCDLEPVVVGNACYSFFVAAIALDGGLEVVDRIFGAVLFGDCERIHRVWVRIPPHPLQAQFPDGDREWASNVPMLKKLSALEDRLGIKFKHVRVLARALTVRKTGFNLYTLGDNQRLEFLGDSLLKYVTTDYLFRHFPRHHEGHLSLLKNSLVNKYTQASVCSDLGLDQFIIRREDNSLAISGISDEVPSSPTRKQQNVKNKADLLEAFIGALFVDKDITWVERFCQVCFWPRLVEFILTQEWNDPKSKLQQCCLTFRSLNEDPEIAHYKILEYSGPSNERVYKVGVFFKDIQLAVGSGRSVQNAQMAAAKNALATHQEVFRQLDFQRSVIAKRYRQPYIDKMLNKLESWDESLVGKFVRDVPDYSHDAADVPEHAFKRRRCSISGLDDELNGQANSNSDMDLDDEDEGAP
uniref:RNase III domain-containing protein n=1 Tax=Mesocestoides corti TaxID=53468 RepID=A0A5K3EYP8_MESCO